MTIFRCSPLAMLFAAGCAQNLPAADTALGRIARMGDVREFTAALKAFGKKRQGDTSRLRRELLAAGFNPRRSDPLAPPTGCEYFDWNGRNWGDVFPKGMILGICRDGIQTGGGYDAV